jgi:hypothetical protein
MYAKHTSCHTQVTAPKAVSLTVQYRISRGLKPLPCQFSLLIDPVMPDDSSTLCTSTLNNKVCAYVRT